MSTCSKIEVSINRVLINVNAGSISIIPSKLISVISYPQYNKQGSA